MVARRVAFARPHSLDGPFALSELECSASLGNADGQAIHQVQMADTLDDLSFDLRCEFVAATYFRRNGSRRFDNQLHPKDLKQCR